MHSLQLFLFLAAIVKVLFMENNYHDTRHFIALFFSIRFGGFYGSLQNIIRAPSSGAIKVTHFSSEEAQLGSTEKRKN